MQPPRETMCLRRGEMFDGCIVTCAAVLLNVALCPNSEVYTHFMEWWIKKVLCHDIKFEIVQNVMLSLIH